MFAMLGLTGVFTVSLFIFREYIAQKTGVPVSFVVFAGVYALYQNVVEVLLSVWRMEDKATAFGIFRILRTVLELFIAIVLIICFNRSFDGSIHAMSFSYGIGAVVALWILFRHKYFYFTFEWRHFHYLLTYGAPLIPHVLASVFIMYTDKLVITHYLGLSSNGVYSVGFMVGQVIGLLQNSFNQAWVPYVFNGLKESNESLKLKIVKWTYIYFVGILLIALLFYLFTPVIFLFLGKAFHEGISVVLWISLGFAFNGMYKMVSVYFFYLDKTLAIAIISVLTAIINIAFVIWLVPRYAFQGAAFGTMLAFFIQFIGTWIWSTRIINMPWGNWKALWKK
jgi:O-antigen/teichoic acid export membrane protein